MIKNILFDWSGTLCDDLGPTLDATNFVFKQFGCAKLSRDEFRAEFQLPYPEYYKRKTPTATLDEIEVHYRTAFDNSPAKVALIPHAREFLDFCREQTIRCFILSSMDPEAFAKQCEQFGLNSYFEHIHSGIRNKEQYIHKLMEQHGLLASETAFIGDMQHDVFAAKVAGIKAIAVLTGYNNAQQLEIAQPEIIVPHLAALQNIMQNFAPARREESVIIKDQRIICHIGLPDEERAEAQEIRLDATLKTKAAFAAMEEDIEKTINYDLLSRRLEELAQSQPTKLIETLAHRLAQCCIEEFGAISAEIEIRKFIMPNMAYSATRCKI